MAPVRVAILCINPWNGGTALQPFSYAAYRIQAALQVDPRLAEAEVRVFEGAGWTVAQWTEALCAWEPHVIGASTYAWSLPVFYPLFGELRERLPEAWRVMGGPAARRNMLALAPYERFRGAVDALVVREGEGPMNDIVAARLAGQPLAALRDIAGLELAAAGGFEATPPRSNWSTAAVASPFQRDSAPEGVSAHLQTFLGCPMSCTFCDWGDALGAAGTYSKEWLVDELRAFRARGVGSVISVDAGLNLNAKAFRNLLAAEAEVGFLGTVSFNAEVYPAHVDGALMEFLQATKPELAVGLQSIEPDVLRLNERPFRRSRFDQLIEALAGVSQVTLEIILGLPGDSPAQFRRTLEHALGLGTNLRVYYCLVLPDGLMSRAPASFAMDYHPISLAMRSCLGWSADDLRRESEYLDEQVAGRGLATAQWPLPKPDTLLEASLGIVPPSPMWAFTHRSRP